MLLILRSLRTQFLTAGLVVGAIGLSGEAFGQGKFSEGSHPQQAVRSRQMTAAELQAIENAAASSDQDSLSSRHLTPRQPPGFPLAQDEQQYVEQLLQYWQRVSDQVKQYKCDFRRFEYDTGSVNLRDPETQQLYAFQIAAGEIRFSDPGKARFETTQMAQFRGPPKFDGGPADYAPSKGHTLWGRAIHECWVCTGEAVYDFDFDKKRSYEQKIPPAMRGNVVESPLPFLFGAKKDDILQRYWVRYIPKYDTKPDGQQVLIEDEYWLDVYPKRIEDARLYSKIELVLSAEDFMPRSLHMYSTNYNPKKNNYSSRYFLFEDRKVNGQWTGLKDGLGIFIKPTLPLGWKVVDAGLARPTSAAASATGGTGIKPR